MNNLKLVRLDIQNFKGIESMNVLLDGNNAVIKGENGTGKTSVFDAFTFLLFGKDSQNKSNFEVKPLDKNGNVKANSLDVDIMGMFELDGQTVTLQRIMKENWTKKRGALEKTLTGHTTTFYINSVKKKKTEFEAYVSEIISSDVFQLITNPLYFNEHIDQKRRRNILLDIAGDIDPYDVTGENEEMQAFIQHLDGENINDYHSRKDERRKEITKEKDGLDARIDELTLSLPKDKQSREQIEREIKEIEDQKQALQEKVHNLKNGGGTAEKKKELSDIEYHLAEIKNNSKMSDLQQVYEWRAKRQEINSNINILSDNITQNDDKITEYQKAVKDAEHRVQQYRDEFKRKRNEEMEYTKGEDCPACGQPLPEEQIKEAEEKATRLFNERKASEQENIQQSAKSEKDKITRMQDNISKMGHKNDEQQKEIDRLTKKVKEIEGKIEHSNQEGNVEESQTYQDKLAERERVKQEIETLQNTVSGSVSPLQNEITELDNQKTEKQQALSDLQASERTQNRIDELRGKEKEIAREHEQIMYELAMIQDIKRRKVELLEGKINDQFDITEFKLFEETLNGDMKDVCKATLNGVPYEAGLNTAGRVNVGIDIIQALQRYYGIATAIFIDNAESVLNLKENGAQTIRLQVEDDQPELNIEISENKKSA